VIALGQAAAGDDGVGFAVLEELRRREIPPSVELLRANDSTALMWLLETSTAVVLVDAAVGANPGQVMVLDTADLAREGVQPVSSHGVGVREVVELARLLSPDRVGESIRIVAITIERPDRFRTSLSPNVAAAILRAADRVVELAGASLPRVVHR
jgi:hydrogenase maturation protease